MRRFAPAVSGCHRIGGRAPPRLTPAITSKSIWTRRDGSAGGSVAQREAPCGELSAVVQTSKSSSPSFVVWPSRSRAFTRINLIPSIKSPLLFSFEFLRLLICSWNGFVYSRAVEQLAPQKTFAIKRSNHESSYARRCRVGARTIHA